MGASRQEHWSGLPFPSPGDLPDPGIEPGSLALYEEGKPSRMFPNYRNTLNIHCSVREPRDTGRC